jgi:hypothetical protein
MAKRYVFTFFSAKKYIRIEFDSKVSYPDQNNFLMISNSQRCRMVFCIVFDAAMKKLFLPRYILDGNFYVYLSFVFFRF